MSALLQTSPTADVASPATMLFDSPITAGSMILAAARTGLSTIPTVTDSLGNTYALVVHQQQSTDNHNLGIWAAYNVLGGTCTVTVTAVGSGLRCVAQEIAIGSGGKLDQSNHGEGTVTPPSAGSVTPTLNDGYAMAAFSVGGSRAFTVGSGWTLVAEVAQKMMAERQIITSLASLTGDATFSVDDAWAACVATFTPPPSGFISGLARRVHQSPRQGWA